MSPGSARGSVNRSPTNVPRAANTVAPNLGADGNTTAEDSQNLNQHLVLRTPDLYTDWLHDAPLKIRWDSFGNTAAAPVRIDLYQDGPNGPALLKNIAATATDTGQYTWIAANSNIDYGTSTAVTAYGTNGVKVWIFKGEILEHDPMAQDKLLAEQQESGGRTRRESAEI